MPAEWGPPMYFTNSDVGYWDDTNHHDEWIVGPANYGFRNKGTIVPSDHVRATPWYRESVKVTSESPSVRHHRWTRPDNSSILLWDYVSTRWISPGHPDVAFWYPPDSFFPMEQNLSDKISNQARNNLSKGDFSIGVAIGESRSTAEMLAGRGGQMAQAILDFKSWSASLGGSKARLANRFAGAWLEGYYGWGSLARDGFSLYNQLQEKMQRPQILKTGSKGSDSVVVTSGDQNQNTATWTAREEVGYKYSIHDDIAYKMNQWGLINPLTIAWELVPLSFVVDWFVPIGNTLSAISATAGLTFVDGYHTHIVEAKASDKLNRPVFDYDLISFNPGEFSYEIYRMHRGVLYDFEPPKLYANRNPFSTNRITSAVALITQAITGRK